MNIFSNLNISSTKREPNPQWPLTATIGLNFWSEVGSPIPMTSQWPQTAFARLLLICSLILDLSSTGLIKKRETQCFKSRKREPYPYQAQMAEFEVTSFLTRVLGVWSRMKWPQIQPSDPDRDTVPFFLIRPVLLRSRIREHINNSLAKAVWGHWEVSGIGEPTFDQKSRPIVAVRIHCGLGSLFVEQMFKFENLFILVVWIFPLFSILLSLTADNWVRKVCVPSILSLEFSKLGVPLFLMIAKIKSKNLNFFSFSTFMWEEQISLLKGCVYWTKY